MRLTTFRHLGQDRLGLVLGAEVIDLQQAQPQLSSDLRANLRSGVDLMAAARAALVAAPS